MPLRGEEWRRSLEPVFVAAEEAGHKIVTRQNTQANSNLFLESKRKQLYKDSPPSKEFMQWTG
jgi:predicted metallo-beta-lactamase superfamily hydrolase